VTGPGPEFSRVVPLARLGSEAFRQEIAATPQECAALAARFGLLALERLSAVVLLERQADRTILLSADFEAAFTQECVVSLDPLPGAVAERFCLRYGAPDAESAADAAADDPAFEPLAGDAIDIGEAVAQEFSLTLPPFPRAPDAAIDLEGAPEEDGPFVPLARAHGRDAQG
jgi:uncharacterized metal-binding protein YceD (DUF177 family)